MIEQTIKVDGKNYEIALHDSVKNTLLSALESLKSDSGNINTKELLQAYLAKCVEIDKIRGELESIDDLLE